MVKIKLKYIEDILYYDARFNGDLIIWEGIDPKDFRKILPQVIFFLKHYLNNHDRK